MSLEAENLALRRLVRQLASTNADYDRRLRALERPAAQRYRSIEGGSQTVYDDEGTPRVELGQQEDGSYTWRDVNAPPPPIPSLPTLEERPGILVVSWDGQTGNGLPWPLDFQRVEVHVGTTTDYAATDETQVTEFTTTKGGSVALALDSVPQFVKLVSVNRSGTESEATVAVAGTPQAPATGSGGMTVFHEATEPLGLGAGDQGALWYDTANGNRLSIWDGADWILVLVDEGALADEAVSTRALRAGAVTTNALAFGAATGEKLSADALNGKVITGGTFITDDPSTDGVQVIIEEGSRPGVNKTGVIRFVPTVGTEGSIYAYEDTLNGGADLWVRCPQGDGATGGQARLSLGDSRATGTPVATAKLIGDDVALQSQGASPSEVRVQQTFVDADVEGVRRLYINQTVSELHAPDRKHYVSVANSGASVYAPDAGGTSRQRVRIDNDETLLYSPNQQNYVWVRDQDTRVQGPLYVSSAIRVTGSAWRRVGATGEPTFENNWTFYNANNYVEFIRNAVDDLVVKGRVMGGASGTTVFTLPSATDANGQYLYRRNDGLNAYAVVSGQGDAVGSVTVFPDGRVNLSYAGTPGWLNFTWRIPLL